MRVAVIENTGAMSTEEGFDPANLELTQLQFRTADDPAESLKMFVDNAKKNFTTFRFDARPCACNKLGFTIVRSGYAQTLIRCPSDNHPNTAR